MLVTNLLLGAILVMLVFIKIDASDVVHNLIQVKENLKRKFWGE